MKKFKKILIFVLSIVSVAALCCFLMQPKTNESSSADFSNIEYKADAFRYVTLSQAGQPIDSEKLQTIVDEEKKEVTYVITNKSVTITLNPLASNLKVVNDSNTITNFFEVKDEIVLTKDEVTEQLPPSFEYNGITYYWEIENTILYIFTNPSKSISIVDSNNSSLVKYDDSVDGTLKIFLTKSYTTKETGFVNSANEATDSCSFEFSIRQSMYTTIEYAINFQKPVVNFFNLTEPIVMFNTYKTDGGGNPYPPEKALPLDDVFDKLQVSFINNNYTEGNPLYFNINFNGFVYNYKLFSKVYNGENLLFVNYIDEYSSVTEEIVYNNSRQLATTFKLDSNKEIIYDAVTKNPMIDRKVLAYDAGSGNTNEFSFIFKNTGRYSIELYDSTHLLGMNNANYYSTSFFIKSESELVSPFSNIYIVAQTLTEKLPEIDTSVESETDENTDGTTSESEKEEVETGPVELIPDEYIVSSSTVNKTVRITFKNLGDFGKDENGNDILLSDVISDITVRMADFGIDHVETIEKVYTVEEIQAALVNNDFTLEYETDAFYQIIINPKQKTDEPINYLFTIIKHAKTTFRHEGNAFEATTPFKTDLKDYRTKIESNINLTVKFSSSAEEEPPITLEKTYINRFQVKFGVKRVEINEYEPIPEKEDEKVPPGVYIQIYGVGDITVYLTYNGVTEVIMLNSENGISTIDRTEYGTYHVRAVDSMGTEAEATFVFKKQMNMSAIVLVVLSSIIAAVIILFVMKARGKVATR